MVLLSSIFYFQTPLHKRIREEKRKSMGAPIYKRKRSFEDSDEEDTEPQNDTRLKRKNSKSSLGSGESRERLLIF